ncbi:hypothetical protein [Candidatus Palauibacter sp.]|uniref:hypothetical protein n=1 Tax=Candidatus Palauibacter sp. TaxID=3101350 RepID=UPI003B5B11E9
MSGRTEIVLTALVALTLVALSAVAAWEEGGEGLVWTLLAAVFACAALGIGALAWAGWGRWLLGRTGAPEPSRAWWRLWFVPWAFWAASFVTRNVIDVFDEVLHGSGGALALLPLVPSVAVGFLAALAAFVLVLVFAFREIGHHLGKRKAG